jgi:hypothetical protein
MRMKLGGYIVEVSNKKQCFKTTKSSQQNLVITIWGIGNEINNETTLSSLGLVK